MATFDDVNTRYAAASAAAQAGGLSASQWLATDDAKNFQKEILGLYDTTADLGKLTNDVAWFNQNLDDPVYGANNRTLRDAANTAYWRNLLIGKDFVPSGNDEGSIIADRRALDNQANDLYRQLVEFQGYQASALQDLLLRQEEAAAQAVPKLPEKSGTVIKGGSANPERVGLDKLMLL